MKATKLFKTAFCLLLAFCLLFSAGCKGPDGKTDGTAGSTGSTEKEDPFVPVLRFVVTSDIHIRGKDQNYESYDRLTAFISTAYAYSDAHPSYKKLDGMFFVGDITNSGAENQQTYFFNYLKENVREDTIAKAVMGNHEYVVSGNFKDNSIVEAPKDFLEHSGYEAVDFHITIGGYHFIFLSTDLYLKGSNMFFSSDKLVWLRKELDAAKADTPDKPIFVFQHEPPQDTMVGSTGSSGDRLLHRLLKEYPQVIDFSGHTHVPLTHPQIIWQKEYTALNTGSLSYLSIPMYDAAGKMTRAKEMDNTGAWIEGIHETGPRTGGMYYIVEIDENSVVRIQRYNLFTKSIWGEPFILDSIDPANFTYTSARKEQAEKPAFDTSAAITVESADAAKPVISFPQANCKDGVSNYRIEFYQDDTLVHTIYRLSENYYGDASPNPLKTALNKLEPGEYTLKVYATSSYALHSDPITTTLTLE